MINTIDVLAYLNNSTIMYDKIYGTYRIGHFKIFTVNIQIVYDIRGK